MEPMTLGSPNNSPATEKFLPAFLLGESASNTPKRNQLSPDQDLLPFGNAKALTPLSNNQIHRQAKSTPNGVKFGPPIIDLYDDMPSTYRPESNVFSPRSMSKEDNTRTHDSNEYNNSAFQSPLASSRSYIYNGDVSNNVSNKSAYTSLQHDSNSAFNNSEYRSPLPNQSYQFKSDVSNVSNNNRSIYTSPTYENSYRSPTMVQQGYKRPYVENGYNNTMVNNVQQDSTWVTIFGVPSELSNEVLEYFKRIGCPTDVHIKPNCNYISVRYATRYQVQQALSLNGVMIKNGTMIGVKVCSDPDNVGKDIVNYLPNDRVDYETKLERLRALSSYSGVERNNERSFSNESALNESRKKSGNSTGGIIDKAIEYLWKW